METIKLYSNGISETVARKVANLLKEGNVIIWPTDTLYGIACDALNPKAIERVCKIKRVNPEKNVLSIVCSDISQAAEYARIENDAFRLIKHNTPGPFTFILRSVSKLPKVFKGRKTVGIRIPDSESALAIAKALGNPILNASIDYSDEDEAREPELIADRYAGDIDYFLLGEEGKTQPSTIIDCTEGDLPILRQGLGQLK